MHMPSTMIQGAVCPVTMGVGAAGVAGAAWLAARQTDAKKIGRFAGITAFIFAAQMLNYPISGATSGHFVGSVLAVSLLGLPLGILSMVIVLAVQCLAFADGGVFALGANVVNMALVGCGAGALICRWMGGSALATSLAAWISVMMSALLCSVELAAGGVASFGSVWPAMAGVHTWIGLGEAILTGVCVALYRSDVETVRWNREAMIGWISLLLAVGLSPLASALPDGLEWVAGHLRFAQEDEAAFGLFKDYEIPFAAGAWWSVMLAGACGVALVRGAALALVNGIGRIRKMANAA